MSPRSEAERSSHFILAEGKGVGLEGKGVGFEEAGIEPVPVGHGLHNGTCASREAAALLCLRAGCLMPQWMKRQEPRAGMSKYVEEFFRRSYGRSSECGCGHRN